MIGAWKNVVLQNVGMRSKCYVQVSAIADHSDCAVTPKVLRRSNWRLYRWRRMLRPTVINTLPRFVPPTFFSSGIASFALHSQLPYIAPVLQLLAFCIGCFDSFQEVVDSAGFGLPFRFVLRLVLVAVALSGIECIVKDDEKLATRVLKDEHGHDGRYLRVLAMAMVDVEEVRTCSAR